MRVRSLSTRVSRLATDEANQVAASSSRLLAAEWTRALVGTQATLMQVPPYISRDRSTSTTDQPRLPSVRARVLPALPQPMTRRSASMRSMDRGYGWGKGRSVARRTSSVVVVMATDRDEVRAIAKRGVIRAGASVLRDDRLNCMDEFVEILGGCSPHGEVVHLGISVDENVPHSDDAMCIWDAIGCTRIAAPQSVHGLSRDLELTFHARSQQEICRVVVPGLAADELLDALCCGGEVPQESGRSRLHRHRLRS